MSEKKAGRPKVPPELKKKTRAFVLNDLQMAELERQAQQAGYTNRNEYLIMKLRLNK